MSRKQGYILVSLLAPFLAIGVIEAFFTAHFRIAWACALCIILCMEGRVQLTERLPRTWWLWVHLSAAVPFFILLSILAFWREGLWLEIVTVVLFVVMVFAGSVLWYRGLRAAFA